MTDTGRIPGEGQPESAGAPQGQPGAPASGGYGVTPQPHTARQQQDDLLLMPRAQGAWGEPVQPDHGGTAPTPTSDTRLPQSPGVAGPQHAVRDHETVRTPAGGFSTAAFLEQPYPHMSQHAQHSQPQQSHADGQPVDPDPHTAPEGGSAPRRPLHLGPPEPAQSGAVRSLAERGPTPTASHPGGAPAAPASAPRTHDVQEVQTTPPGSGEQHEGGDTEPEYLDVPTSPQNTPQAAPEQTFAEPAEHRQAGHEHVVPGPQALEEPAGEEVLPGPQLGVLPAQPGAWEPQPQLPEQVSAETVDPSAEPELSGPDLASQPAPAPQPQPVQHSAQTAGAEQPEAPTTGEVAPAATASEGELPLATQPQDGTEHGAGVPRGTPEDSGTQPVQTPPTGPQPVASGAQVPAPGAQWHSAQKPPSGPDQPQEPTAPVAEPTVPVTEPTVQGEAGAAVSGHAVPAPRAAEPEAHPRQEREAQPEQDAATPTSADQPADLPQQSPEASAAAAAPRPAADAPAPPHDQPDVDGEPPTPEDADARVEPPPSDEGQPHDQATGAAEAPHPQSAPAPGYSEADRQAVHRAMRERRDVRNGFRPDPIPHEVLLRVLEAAHTAPSVGHSQPWDFVIIRSEETRRTMHELATRQREAYARSLPKGRAKKFRELKVEAILDTPVNIVVTADATRGGRHTLGRQTQPQMAPYSSALAVENLWLAARAEGLGVGWVSFFDEREMVRELDLPEHLEVVAYLCVGYVDAFPEEPELVQSGWSSRRPLSWVVHEESYGRRVLPGAEAHDLLSETLAGIRPLDAKALGEAWERQKRMTKPTGALGMLEIISAQLSGLARKCPPPIPEPAAVAVFAGDHGVHAQGVTTWPQEVTAQMVANFLGAGAVCNAFANQVGAEVCVVDVGVAAPLPSTPGLLPRKIRPGTEDFSTTAAMTREEAQRAVEVGIETARDLVAAGNKALLTGEMGIANTTVSAALIAVYTGADPAEVTGQGTGISDEMHSHKTEVVRRALELHQVDPADPLGVLSAVGGLEHAALVGLILGGASLRTPVILDGVSATAAALVARAMAPESLAACVAGHRSPEPGHVAALAALGLRPLVDLDLRLGEGTGALLALPVVQSAARAMHEVATFDAAGVTEKN